MRTNFIFLGKTHFLQCTLSYWPWIQPTAVCNSWIPT